MWPTGVGSESRRGLGQPGVACPSTATSGGMPHVTPLGVSIDTAQCRQVDEDDVTAPGFLVDNDVRRTRRKMRHLTSGWAASQARDRWNRQRRGEPRPRPLDGRRHLPHAPPPHRNSRTGSRGPDLLVTSAGAAAGWAQHNPREAVTTGRQTVHLPALAAVLWAEKKLRASKCFS